MRHLSRGLLVVSKRQALWDEQPTKGRMSRTAQMMEFLCSNKSDVANAALLFFDHQKELVVVVVVVNVVAACFFSSVLTENESNANGSKRLQYLYSRQQHQHQHCVRNERLYTRIDSERMRDN
jgi:uncharacterized protein (DUF952 family)